MARVHSRCCVSFERTGNTMIGIPVYEQPMSDEEYAVIKAEIDAQTAHKASQVQPEQEDTYYCGE